jgi:hypothetical protein
MRQLSCENLVLKSAAGDVLCSDIVDFLMGDPESDESGTYRRIVLSLPRFHPPAIGQQVCIENTATNLNIWFVVLSSHYDLTIPASKLEGRMYKP